MSDKRKRRDDKRREKELRKDRRREQVYEILLSCMGLYSSFRSLPSQDRVEILQKPLIKPRVVLGSSAEGKPQAAEIQAALSKELQKIQHLHIEFRGEPKD